MRLEIPDFELVQADKRRNTAEKTLTLADLRAPHRRRHRLHAFQTQ